VRSCPRLPPVGVPIDGTAFTASSLVILPSLPVPVKLLEQYFFRLFFLAAGDGVPEACAAAEPLLLSWHGSFCFRASAAFGAVFCCSWMNQMV
jgi:hypothetical protein